MADVRDVQPHEWESLRAIRLQALSDSPEAFCTTYEDALGYSNDVWMGRAAADGASKPVVAVDDGAFIALAVGIICDDGELDVVSVWVSPPYRGTGVARRLMEHVEVWGRDRGAVVARLDVEAGNDRAYQFYTNLGYTSTGKRETYPGRTWLHRVLLRKDLRSH